MLAVLASLIIASPLQPLDVNVGGTVRHALVAYGSNNSVKSPIIFAFHGHGGNMNYAARKYKLEDLWPEATIVYMDGLPTASPRVDEAGSYNGWQMKIGDQDDRDIKFFDKTLAVMRTKVKVDDSRIYSMGHSNGALFTYLLWISHPNVFAAIGCAAGGFGRAPDVTPVPVIHIAGDKDTLVPYRGQMLTVARLRRINSCSADGHPWDEAGCTIWPSSVGAPVVLYSYSGTHAYPDDASEKIIRFFKQHAKG